MPTERIEQRLQDILDNAVRIRDYTEGMTREQFEADRRTRDAVERCLERMSEAARKLGTGYDEAYPQVDLPALRALGNMFRHEYDRVSPGRIWLSLSKLGDLEQFAHGELRRTRD